MKASFLFSVSLAATLFVSVGHAEPSATDAKDAEIIKRYDTNKDGKLDEAEIAAVKEKMMDSKMEQQEEKRDRLQEKQKEWLTEYDLNKNGKLDPDEKVAMEKAVRARIEKAPRLLKRFDTDGDGKLSDAEWTAVREKVIARVQEGKEVGKANK